jgi:hypothetical protein
MRGIACNQSHLRGRLSVALLGHAAFCSRSPNPLSLTDSLKAASASNLPHQSGDTNVAISFLTAKGGE